MPKKEKRQIKGNSEDDFKQELVTTKEILSLLQGTVEKKVIERTRELAEARVKEEAILQSVGEGLIVTDEKGIIIRINDTGKKLLGRSGKEVRGRYFYDVLVMENEKGEKVSEEKHPIKIALNMGQSINVGLNDNHFYVRKDGTRFPVSGKVTQVIFNDKVTGVIKIFRDVTQEREIDRAKSEFVSLAAHQLRTPLTAVNWYTEMLLMGDAGTMTDIQKKYLEEIQTGNQRMLKLVNTLLNVSNLELGTFIIEPQPTDIKVVVKKIIEELELDIFKQKIGLNEYYEENIPLFNVDQRLLHMIFQNLLSNAIKYTPTEGTINFSIKKEKKDLLITVQDTGYGIPEKQQVKIFSKFFRADNVLEKDTEGTGLGLYIVKAMVEHCGGSIWFESVEGVGTSFYVRLPIVNSKIIINN